MKKKLVTILMIIVACAAFADAPAGKVVVENKSTKPLRSTPVRFSFWPTVWQWPKNVNVYGASFGLPSSYNSGKAYVAGLDMAFFKSSCNVKGLQLAGGNIGKNSDGAQVGVANIYEKFNGVQIGLYDETKTSTAVQLGVVNKAVSSKNVQIGLINMMDNGLLPVCPLINMPKCWFKYSK